MKDVAWMMAAVLAMVVCSAVHGADANDAGGLTVWGLGGNGLQEGRVGWMFDKWAVEPAAGIKHIDAVDEDGIIEEWPVCGYLFFHAVDADMLARAFKWDVDLPAGEFYFGPMIQYSHDREKEWAGGVSVGTLVDLGSINVKWKGWSVATEYEWLLWNTGDNKRTLLAGLMHEF